MKALTIQQPWASLIVYGPKRVENRTWSTHYRGPILIHVGKKRDEEAWYGLSGYQLDNSVSYLSGIIGVANLIGVLNLEAYRAYAFDPFACGPKCWILSDVRPLSEPIPMGGQLGLFNVPKEIAALALERAVDDPLTAYVKRVAKERTAHV